MTAVIPPAELVPEEAPTRAHRLYRHRSDVARLVFNLALLGGLVLLAWLAPNGLRTFGVDVLNLVDSLPRTLVEGLLGVVQLVAIVLPGAVVLGLLWRRAWALLGILAAAAALAAASMALLSSHVAASIPISQIGFDRYRSWLVGGQFPSSTYLAGATAAMVAAGPWLSRRWRRAGWVFIAAAVAARVLTATEVPIRVGMLLTLGAAAGSLALVLLGGPRRRLDAAVLVSALDPMGIDPSGLRPGPDDEGVPTFRATAPDGRGLVVKAAGRDQRDGDLLIGLWQRLTLRGLGDDLPRRSPRAAAAHEALALGLFGTAGASVPTPLAVTRTEDEVALLVTSLVPGRRLADLAPEELTDDLLDSLLAQVALLQHRRMAHRRLDPDHVIVDGATTTLTDLRWADLDASDEVLGAEVAEVLAALAAVVGDERAVAAAVRSLPVDQRARAVPLVQAPVLTPGTRRALKGDKGAITRLRDHLAEASGVEDVTLAPVSRVTVKGTVSLVGSVVLGYYLISLATDWQDIWDAFRDADLSYILPILVLTLGTYFTGALSLLGAVTTRLGLLRTTAVMLGQSFLNRFTPANAGGMAMRLRYLQLNGVETPVAAAAIGLTSAASGVAQAVLIVVFLVWGGASDRLSDFSLPDVSSILIPVLVIGVVVTVVLYSGWGRRVVRPWVQGAVAKVRANLAELARDPRRLAMLMGGAVLGKLCNITSFWLSTLAFGVDISYAKAGALFMIANTIGSAVPSPGGVGGIEAALTAVLISYGVESGTAAAVVLFYRTLTFWLPTVPGWGFLQYTQRKGIV